MIAFQNFNEAFEKLRAENDVLKAEFVKLKTDLEGKNEALKAEVVELRNEVTRVSIQMTFISCFKTCFGDS